MPPHYNSNRNPVRKISHYFTKILEKNRENELMDCYFCKSRCFIKIMSIITLINYKI